MLTSLPALCNPSHKVHVMMQHPRSLIIPFYVQKSTSCATFGCIDFSESLPFLSPPTPRPQQELAHQAFILLRERIESLVIDSLCSGMERSRSLQFSLFYSHTVNGFPVSTGKKKSLRQPEILRYIVGLACNQFQDCNAVSFCSIMPRLFIVTWCRKQEKTLAPHLYQL